MSKVVIQKNWERQDKKRSTKTTIFVCESGQKYGKWVEYPNYIKLSKLIRKEANLREVIYSDSIDYTIHYLINVQ